MAGLAASPVLARPTVALELVLAVDSSGSVDHVEFNLQTRGLAAAFRDPAVIDAILDAGPVAVALVHWSGPDQQRLALDWTLVSDAGSAARFAKAVEAVPRAYFGATALGDVLTLSAGLFGRNPFPGGRRVIDLSGDGPNNTLHGPEAARDFAVASGITINGLAILNESPDLDVYFRDRVIGGPGSFLVVARDYRDFARAMRLKLIREIRGQAVAALEASMPRSGPSARGDKDAQSERRGNQSEDRHRSKKFNHD